jgi:hypothetical protein
VEGQLFTVITVWMFSLNFCCLLMTLIYAHDIPRINLCAQRASINLITLIFPNYPRNHINSIAAILTAGPLVVDLKVSTGTHLEARRRHREMEVHFYICCLTPF